MADKKITMEEALKKFNEPITEKKYIILPKEGEEEPKDNDKD